MEKNNKNIGFNCPVCDEEMMMHLYCYPETTWTEAVDHPGTVKKIGICHACAVNSIRKVIHTRISEFIMQCLDEAAKTEEVIFHLQECLEDPHLETNYLLDFDFWISPNALEDTTKNPIIVLAGNVMVGRKYQDIAVFRGIRKIPVVLEEVPDKAFDWLYMSLLDLVYDMTPRVDYTPNYEEHDEAFDSYYVYRPLLGKTHPAIEMLGIPAAYGTQAEALC